MKYNINLTDGRTFIVDAKSKAEASKNAVEKGILTRDDFHDILSIEETFEGNLNEESGKVCRDVPRNRPPGR